MHGARKLYGPQLRIVAGVKSLNVPVSIVDLDFTPELGPGRDGGEEGYKMELLETYGTRRRGRGGGGVGVPILRPLPCSGSCHCNAL